MSFAPTLPSNFAPHPSLTTETNRRDAAYYAGTLAKNDRIVFDRTGLVMFLKAHGVEVGPNSHELSVLAKYAAVGRFNEASATEAAAASDNVAPAAAAVEEPIAAPAAAPAAASTPAPSASQITSTEADRWIPTRKVREGPGGGSAQIASLFGGEVSDAELREAEARVRARRGGLQATQSQVDNVPQQTQAQAQGGFKPSTKINAAGGTGGKSSIVLG